MKRKGWQLVGVVVFVGALLCVGTYGDKDEQTQMELPAAVKTAVMALYPQAEIEEAEAEEEGLKVYEVEVEHNDQEFELTLAPDGTLVEVESEMAVAGLPEAVAKAIAKAADGATIKEVNKEVTYAIVTLVKLDKPQTSYEAELSSQGAECEIEVAADGTVLEQSEWKTDDDDDDD